MSSASTLSQHQLIHFAQSNGAIYFFPDPPMLFYFSAFAMFI